MIGVRNPYKDDQSEGLTSSGRYLSLEEYEKQQKAKREEERLEKVNKTSYSCPKGIVIFIIICAVIAVIYQTTQ